MSFPRLIVSAALVIATLLACLASHGSTPAPTIPARQLLTLLQKGSAVNYTFDRSTSEALASVPVPRPPQDASQTTLESALREAGFQLRPAGPESNKLLVVERIRG